MTIISPIPCDKYSILGRRQLGKIRKGPILTSVSKFLTCLPTFYLKLVISVILWFCAKSIKHPLSLSCAPLCPLPGRPYKRYNHVPLLLLLYMDSFCT